MSPEQALNNLRTVCDAALLNATDRRAIDMSFALLQSVIMAKSPKDQGQTGPNDEPPASDNAGTENSSENSEA